MLKRKLSTMLLLLAMLMFLAAFAATTAMAEGTTATIWTDKQDYSPAETVTIYGSGFNPEAPVNMTVARPDSSIDEWAVTSDSSGSFTTTYLLDGITGTYMVTATDGTNTATTTFEDGPLAYSPSRYPDPGEAEIVQGGYASFVLSLTADKGTNEVYNPGPYDSIPGYTEFPTSWLSYTPASLRLSAGITNTTTVKITVPSDATTGIYAKKVKFNPVNAQNTSSPGSGVNVYVKVKAAQRQITVTADPAGAVGGTFNVTYIKGGITYTNRQNTTIWTEMVDANTNVTIIIAQDIIYDVSPGKRYKFDGYSPSATVNMTENKTITLLYKTQYYVTFNQTGLDSTATGTVVTVNGTAKASSDLPYSIWVNSSDSLVFSYANVSSTVSGKRFIIDSVNATSPLTVTSPTTVIGNYKTQYYLTVISPYATPSGAGWYNSSDTAYATLDKGIFDHENGTRRVFTHWSMDATGTNFAQSKPILMDGPKTAIANWKTQYQVTFQQTGSGATVQVTYTADTDPTENVPFSIWIKAETTLAFTYDSIINDGQPTRYVLISLNQTSPFTVNEPTTIMATYKTQHYLTVNHIPDDPTLDGHQTGQGYYDANTNATVTADQYVGIVAGASRYMFDHWSGDATGTSTTTEINMTAPKTATANYKTQYYITVTSAHDEPTASQWVDQGGSLTVSVTSPADESDGTRYRCTGYTLDDNPPVTDGSTSYSFTDVQSAHTITFNWITQYRLIVSSDHDSPTPSVGEHWNDTGTQISASVTSPADESDGTRYRCTGWMGTGSVPLAGTEALVIFTITEPSTLTWNWIPQYKVTFNQTGLDNTATGTVVTVNDTAKTYSDLPYEPWFDSGDKVFYSYETIVSSGVPDKQFRRDSVTGPASPITVTSPITVIGNYVTQYYLTVKTHPEGLIPAPTPQSGWYDECTYVTLTAPQYANETADTRYRFDYWDVDGTPVEGNPIEVHMDAAHTATAHYVQQYYLTVTSPCNEPTPKSDWFDAGTEITASVTSPWPVDAVGTRYVCTGWTGTGSVPASGTESSVKFTINAPSSITWNWKTQYEITVTASPDGALGGTFEVTYTSCGTTYTNVEKTTKWTVWVDAGTTVTVSEPQEYVPSEEGVDGVRYEFDSYSPSDSVDMTEAKTITLAYKTQYYLTVISPYDTPGGEDWYYEGETAYATLVDGFVAPNIGFVGWSEDASGLDLLSDPITMDTAKTAIAKWEASLFYGDVRTIGFWKHQVNVWYFTELVNGGMKIKGIGTAQVSQTDLMGYLQFISDNSGYAKFTAIWVEGNKLKTLENAYKILTTPTGPNSMKMRAEQQLLGVWLNLARKAFFWNTELSQSSEYIYVTYGLEDIGEAIKWSEAELAADRNFEAVKTVCDSINNNLGIVWGT